MEWRDEGVLLSMRPHGESAVIIEVFTPSRGRHAGVVRGGASRKLAPALQPGNLLDLVWQARIQDHLGQFTAELIESRSALWDNRLTLAGLNAVCALLHFALPERDPHADLYHASLGLLRAMDSTPDWPRLYLGWEMLLLDVLGYGLDLSHCAVSGATEGLAYVSPKTGRAIARDAAGQWADRLLALPPCLLGAAPQDADELVLALSTTGHFLTARLAHDLAPRPFPVARQRLIDLLARAARE